jgi:hypothetical protein
MRRVHIAPYVALTLIGLIMIFSLEGTMGILFGFILTVLGAGGSVYHLATDEHLAF